MPRPTYKTCRRCGGHVSEVGELSHTRLCRTCGPEVLAAAVLEQVNHDGPTFQHWRRRIAASVGAVVSDDLRQAV